MRAAAFALLDVAATGSRRISASSACLDPLGRYALDVSSGEGAHASVREDDFRRQPLSSQTAPRRTLDVANIPMLDVKKSCSTSQTEPSAMDWREVLQQVHRNNSRGTLVDNFQCVLCPACYRRRSLSVAFLFHI